MFLLSDDSRRMKGFRRPETALRRTAGTLGTTSGEHRDAAVGVPRRDPLQKKYKSFIVKYLH